ncbi:Tat pathway signal protein [Streptomyces sp. IB2014 016-6]|uniref:Tat pathway signal protein n=1 Tax=Streptomyces sp. IB2014 016-6 TaxID=2517818 RepID=UPI0011CA8633|nr:Tat pathway signal protein [Streptomyces sp. IB2014 016-6]TXL87233.1 Tat pathway signal protein [Streptomyces sp. IB2014 016-6]
MARERNERLAAVVAETNWSQTQLAGRIVRVAEENGADTLRHIGRSHVSMWILGTRPTGQAPAILCETLSRKLQRTITLREIGLLPGIEDELAAPQWSADPLATLIDLGNRELDMERRHLLATSAYSVVGLSLPSTSWWNDAPSRGASRASSSGRTVGAGDVESIREMTTLFSRRDQRRGGGAGRAALVAYLRTEAVGHLGGRFMNERVRREAFSAVAELTYLNGWMAFDASEQSVAQHYLSLAVSLAAEADDAPLAGHILRAMAHQAGDLGHRDQALNLATASVEGARFTRASPRERALLGVVHARTLAATGNRNGATAALLRAENDLRSATSTDEEPSRVFFFSEASLAHETACALRDLGDLSGAQREFRRSVRTRQAEAFSRTHAVTLGYLGAVQVQQGNIERACEAWGRALDAMDGVQSGRARDTVIQMRRLLSPFRGRGSDIVAQLDDRARQALGRVA